MEMLGVRRKQKRNDDALKKKKKEKDIKVTYISSPMKVKTSASNFRALVQELTGQYSNVADKFLQQESAVHDHDDDEIENIDLAAMAGSSSNISDDQRHDEVEEIERSSPSSWLDLLTEDSCSGFQYSRSLFEPFNQQQQYMKFDLVEI